MDHTAALELPEHSSLTGCHRKFLEAAPPQLPAVCSSTAALNTINHRSTHTLNPLIYLFIIYQIFIRTMTHNPTTSSEITITTKLFIYNKARSTPTKRLFITFYLIGERNVRLQPNTLALLRPNVGTHLYSETCSCSRSLPDSLFQILHKSVRVLRQTNGRHFHDRREKGIYIWTSLCF